MYLAFLVCLAVVYPVGADLEVTLAPSSCVVLALTDHLHSGPDGSPMHVTASTGSGRDGGACLRVSGLELDSGSKGPAPAACRFPAVTFLQPNSALSRLVPRASAIPQSGGAFLTIESACHNPALLTLHFASIEWLGSSSSRPYGIHAAGHRKLLHRVLTQALAPGEAGNASVAFLPSNVPRPSAVPRPGHTAAQNTSSSDKYTPAQQPVAALNSTTAPLNRTAAPLNPGAGAALSNATNNSTERLACCCRYVSGALPYDPQQYTGRTCCCGRYRTCCGGNSLLSQLCGNRSTCGVMLIVVSVVCVFIVSVCIMGGFCWRRRRRSRAAVAAAGGSGVELPVTSSQRRAAAEEECRTILALPSEKLEEMLVGPAPAELWGTAVECSICLDAFEVNEDNWRLFPCPTHHGACSNCTVDLVKHNRCRVPDQKRVVRCPLCRELAVVPHSLLPAELILELAKPPSSRRSSQRRSSSTVATVAVPASPL
ncbi:hypothetical protein D9Q98_005903 [Chlorella vulgaris]|uniref:RING-type domain-containing protein n=1 Tax=Chlorella vulgaris TaxID=3077 RepID=A0A9D4Z0U9_CHLVU|nr:hypothetical protein D9Q98_005903 [Chlorella vulgaris]